MRCDWENDRAWGGACHREELVQGGRPKTVGTFGRKVERQLAQMRLPVGGMVLTVEGDTDERAGHEDDGIKDMEVQRSVLVNHQ